MFVGFLGERAGVVEPVPTELSSRYRWLESCGACGLGEIEAVFAAFHGGAARSLYYRRDPAFLAEVPDEERKRYLPADGAEAARAAALTDRLRAADCSFVDGYTFHWHQRHDPAAALPELAWRLVDDIWSAIEREIMASLDTGVIGGSPASRHDVALPFHDDVEFTVYRPRVVRPLEWSPVLAFAHLGEAPLGADPRDDPIRQVEQRARAVLGDRIDTYSSVRQDSSVGLPEEAELTFVLDLPGLDVKAPRRTFLWVNAVHMEEFQVRPAPGLDGRVARGSLLVYHGSILIAEVRLAIRVDARVPVVVADRPVHARPFRKIFPSYSHRDTAIVEEFEAYAEAAGDRYLRDVRELRSGEVWSTRLLEFINQADVFQLFWSHNAMNSRYVEQEWRYALSVARPNFIRPTYWEQPMPEAPGRPPEELRQIHFHLLGRAASRDGPIVAPPQAYPTAMAPPGSTTSPQWAPPQGSVPPPMSPPTIQYPVSSRGSVWPWLLLIAAVIVVIVVIVAS